MPFSVPSSRKASRLAIAAALMSIGAFGVTAFDAPAFAQKKQQKENETNYSKEFVEAFGPIDEALRAENPDYAALREQAKAARASVKTMDDQYAYGSTLQAIGEKLEDTPLRREGMDLMLTSGKVPEADVARYTYVAGQLAFNDDDYAAARQKFEEAQALGYQDPQIGSLIAATYEREGDPSAGLAYYAEQINTQMRAGQTPDEALLQRAFAIAYNNDFIDDATTFSVLLVEHHPSDVAWGNAVALQRNFGTYSDPELLDLLRLLRATGGMSDARDYTDYIDAANYRRLPGEVSAVAQEGMSAGLLDSGDTFVREAVDEANTRAPGLRADLGALERDAKAAGATANLAMAAGDAFLNFDEAAKAAELYELALTRPDVDRAMALTRLGIAQVKAGDYAAAQETFDQVEGNRKTIARLWAAYAEQQAPATGG